MEEKGRFDEDSQYRLSWFRQAVTMMGYAETSPPGSLITEIKRMVSPFETGETEMALKRQDLLNVFDDTELVNRFLESPFVLIRRAEAERQKGRITPHSISDMKAGVILLVLQHMPVRRQNILRTRVYGDDVHLEFKRQRAFIAYDKEEVKNNIHLRAELDAEAKGAIGLYLKHYRPVAISYVKGHTENGHLFPGKGNNYCSETSQNEAFAARMFEIVGVRITLHEIRHLMGKIIMDGDPANLEVVRSILGQKSVETTRRYYLKNEEAKAATKVARKVVREKRQHARLRIRK